MPVTLCDKDVYCINYEDMTRSTMFSFFLGGHREDVLALYDLMGKYKGCITYPSLLHSFDEYGAIISEKLYMNDNIWFEAQNIFNSNKNIIVPVFNSSMEMIYFAKYDNMLENQWNELIELRNNINIRYWQKFNSNNNYFHIVGINDVLFFLRQWLLSMGAHVSVEGEQWSYLNIYEECCENKDAVVIDEKCFFVNLLHEKYRDWMKKDIIELKQMANKVYMGSIEDSKKVLFYMPAFAYFMDSIIPLILKYLKEGKECIITFADIDSIIDVGYQNIRRVISIISKLEAEGGKVCSVKTKGGIW